MYAQLGTTIFDGLKSFVTFSSEEDAVIVEHALINRKPRLQGAGIGLNVLSITLFLHQEFCMVKDEISKLRASKDSYEVLPLLWGNGEIEGNFVIATLSREVKEQDYLGNAIAASISLTLKEYVQEDVVNSQQQTAQTNAFASGDKKPATKSTRVNPVSCNSFVSKQLSIIKSNGAKVDGYMHSYRVGSDDNIFATTCLATIKIASSTLLSKATDPSYSCINGNTAMTTACTKINQACDALTSTIQKNEALRVSPDINGINLYTATLDSGIQQLQASVSSNLQSNVLRK